MLNLDIQLIDTYSLNTLALADISDYDNLVIKNPTLEISAPGFNKQVVFFTPKQINVYTPADLKIDCDKEAGLPDGIYTIKYSIFPNIDNVVEKYFFRTNIIENAYQQAVLSILQGKCSCKSDYNKEILSIRLLMEGAVAASSKNQIELSYQLYNKASEKINRIKNCKC